MPATQFTTTTLSEALTHQTNDFTVASTASISVGDLLLIREELVKVQEIPVSGRVKVLRGYEGTEARAHANAQRLFIIANPEDLKRDTKDQLAVVGASGVYPDYLLPGQRATDGQGNVYILVDLTATMYGGATVAISADGLFTAGALKGGAHQGPVGVLVEPGTSNQYVWAQIYGYNAYATVKTTGAFTSAAYATATTTVSTPNVGLTPLETLTTAAEYFIHGMFITVAGTSQTSATSTPGQYAGVFLNYPYVYNRLQSEATSNS
jgi:hypothetical protein